MRLLFILTVIGMTLSVAGPIETIAGTGKAGYGGDGGKATEALLNQPFHCDFDAAGNLYIIEQFNHTVRKVDAKTGVITTVAGTGKKGYTGDGGPATQATMNDPHALVLDANGDIYIADRLNFAIRKVDGKTGTMSTVAGNGQKRAGGVSPPVDDGGPAAKAMLVEPDDCCLDGKGGLLIADVGDWRIRRVDLKTGVIATFAGTGRPKEKMDRSKIGDGGPAAKAIIHGARAVCVDIQGITYICEREGNGVRKVDRTGVITTIAGTGAKGYSGDGGDARKAAFNGPKAIRCDKEGNLWLADTENHAIRRIDAKTNIVTTVAGGRQGGDGDGGPAAKASLNRPHGCILDSQGRLYIADSGNNRVRRVLPPVE